MYESQLIVTRTVYEAKCPKCNVAVTVLENPPREHFCTKCSEWVPYVAVSYSGPDLKK